MAEGHSVMRTMLLGSLLEAARHNRARGAEDIRLFEYGAVYLDRAAGAAGNGDAAAPTGNPWYPRLDPALPLERPHLGALLTGRLRPATWGEPEPPRAGFFAAKAVLAALLGALRIPWSVEPAREPFLHPGRAARVLVGDGRPAGWLGELHPGVAAGWDLGTAAGFELDWGLLVGGRPGRAALRGPHVVPRRAPGPRRRRARRRARRAGGRGRARGRRPAAARRRGVRRLPRRAGRRRGACRSRWRSSSARPTGR